MSDHRMSAGANVTCPDWRRLVADREAAREATVADSRGWAEAIHHLDVCESCRESALAADPLLVFRRLPRAASAHGGSSARHLQSGVGFQGGEIVVDLEAMKQAVATLRSTGPLQESSQRASVELTPPSPRPVVRRLARRVCAVAAGLMLLSLLGLSPAPPAPGTSSVAQSPLAASPGSLFEAAKVFGQALSYQPTTPATPSIEELDLPNSRVYQKAYDGIAIAMIVDESLDV